MYLCYVRNAEHADDSVNYWLFNLGVFGSYQNNSSFDKDSLFSCSLVGNFQQLVAAIDVEYSNVEDFMTL